MPALSLLSLISRSSPKQLGPYGVRNDNLLSISRSFVGGGSVPRSESPDGAGSYRTAPQGPLFRAQSRKSVASFFRPCFQSWMEERAHRWHPMGFASEEARLMQRYGEGCRARRLRGRRARRPVVVA